MDFVDISSDLSILSSLAIILGALFVIVQLRQNNKLIKAATEQAKAAAAQASLTTEQLKQSNAHANMDMIMRLYEFANTAEFQTAWLTVVNAHLATFEDFQKMSKMDQVSFFQIASLFESLGILVERGIVDSDIVDDMFLTKVAWKSMKGFVLGVRRKHGEEENFIAFERLYERLKGK